MKKKNHGLGVSALYITTSKIIASAMSMLVAMLLSRFRTLEEYGTYSQLLTVISLASSLFMLGLPNSINYFLARCDDDESRKKFLSVYYTLNTILCAIIGTVLVLAIPLIEIYFDNALIRGFAFFLALYPWTYITISGIENVLAVYKRPTMIMGFRIAHSVSLLAAVTITTLLGQSFKTYVILYLAVETAFALTVYIMVNRLAGRLKPAFSMEQIKKIFIFSLPIGLATSIGALNIELDKLMIGWFFSTEDLAIYTNATKIMPFGMITTSLVAVVMPQIVKMFKRDENENAVRLWGDAAVFSFIILSFFSFALTVFAEEVILVLYSSKYLPGVNIFRISNFALMMSCTYYGMVLNTKGKTKFILYSSIISLLINVLLNLLLISFMGMEGAAIATVLSQMIINLAQIVFSSRITKIELSEAFPWKELLSVFLVGLAVAAVFYLLKRAIHIEGGAGSIIKAVILGIIWAGVHALTLRKKALRLWKKLNAVT